MALRRDWIGGEPTGGTMTKSAYLESLLDENLRDGALDRAFDWDVLDIVLGEKSVIDIPKVQTETVEEAHIFLKSLGYNLDVPAHTNMVEKIRKEAVAFIERRLVRDPDGIDPPLKVPTQVRMEKDVRKLLVWASGPLDDELQNWACSVLRVMYTITHVQNDLALNFFPQIQKQILDRVLRFVYTDSSGAVHLGQDSNGIRLYMMDIKSQKSGESMILKLLHKVENEGSDIFDRVGFRFVTYSKVECLLALQYLQANHVFAYPNVKVARSRNTLVNHVIFRAMIDAPFRRWVNKEIGTDDLIAIAEDIAGSPACMPRRDPKQMSYNVYSSTEYSSISNHRPSTDPRQGAGCADGGQRRHRTGGEGLLLLFPDGNPVVGQGQLHRKPPGALQSRGIQTQATARFPPARLPLVVHHQAAGGVSTLAPNRHTDVGGHPLSFEFPPLG